MLIDDLHLSAFNGLSKYNPDGTREVFYLIGFSTLRVKYDEKTRVIKSLEAGGHAIPLNDFAAITQINKELDKAAANRKPEKPQLSIKDLHVNAFRALTDRREDGNTAMFGLLGFNTLRIIYNENTGAVSLIEYNGNSIPLDNFKTIAELNEALDRAAEERKKAEAPEKKLMISELHIKSFRALAKKNDDGTVELFGLLGFNTLRVVYNENTGIVDSIEYNGQNIQLDDKVFIAALNASLDKHASQFTTPVAEDTTPKLMIGDLKVESFRALVDRNEDGTVALFGLLGFNTLKIIYNENTGVVGLIEYNGNSIPLDDKEFISKLNEKIEEVNSRRIATPAPAAMKPKAMITDLHVSSFPALVDRREDGEVALFGLIGFNTLKIVFNEKTGEVALIELNGQTIPLENEDILAELNEALDRAAERRKKTKESFTTAAPVAPQPTGIMIDEINIGSYHTISKRDADGTIELFGFAGIDSTSLRIRYSSQTGIVSLIEVNGKALSLDDPAVVGTVNGIINSSGYGNGVGFGL